MVAVPAIDPVTTPDPSIEATLGELLTHEPPLVVEDNVVVLPTHTAAVPEIAAGTGLTVTVAMALQPALNA
jgi:hypothetical protein